MEKHHDKSAMKTLAFSISALAFYFPANIFPFMTIELYGNRNSSTIWRGILSLSEAGSWPVAVVVFLASILIPFVKLLILFYLSLTARSPRHRQFKLRLYQFVEAVGRWSMLDIFILAILVAVIKLGAWTRAVPEVGSLLFLFVVIFTMLASASFDPQIIGKNGNEKRD